MVIFSRVRVSQNKFKDMSFSDLALRAVESQSEMLALSGSVMQVDAEMPMMNCDAKAIGELLCKLIENSVNYRKNTQQIEMRIGTRIDDGQQVYFIDDNGIGIEKRYQDRIFDLFE